MSVYNENNKFKKKRLYKRKKGLYVGSRITLVDPIGLRVKYDRNNKSAKEDLFIFLNSIY